MTILLLGDSHSDPFVNMPNVSRCDLSKCDQWLFTSYRFTNPADFDLWSNINSWLSSNTINSSNPSKILVITGGEIDIRAHYWRHIPREYQHSTDIVKYVERHAVQFFNTIKTVCNTYKLDHVVVWGSPVAGEKAQYNNEYPFSGSSQTRNKLIHMWNVAFGKLIANSTQVSLASAYYDFINLDYTTITPSPSHDGVHWHDSYGPVFWENIILPATTNNGIFLGKNWEIMRNETFSITETSSQGTQKYDTWVRFNQLNDTNEFNQLAYVNGNTYVWVTANDRSRLPEQYMELTIT